MSETAEIEKKAAGLLNELNEATITGELTEVNKMYVEIGFLKNLMLGSIQAFHTFNPETYGRFIGVLRSDTFKKRLIDDPEELFPFLKMSQKDIRAILSNEVKSNFIFMMSPSMTTEEFLLKRIGEYRASNEVLGNIDPMVLTVNTYPLMGLSKKLIFTLTKEYTKTFGVNVEIISEDCANINEADILNHDAYFIQNLLHFSTTYGDQFNDRKFIDKYMTAIKAFMEKPENFNQESQKDIFDTVGAVFNFAINFEYLDPPRCIE